jgi:cytochrome c
MKIKLLGLAGVLGLMVACGGQNTTESSNENSSAQVAEQTSTVPAGKQLISKSDCMSCHADKSKIIGPSYLDIANKYQATAENITLLAGKIINGGQGVWGEIPMTPHPQMSQADAEEMVKYILTIK